MAGLKLQEVIVGARPVHHGEVALVLQDAFPEAPTFEAVAALLHVDPKLLLISQLSIHPDKATEATRTLLRISVLDALYPGTWQDYPSHLTGAGDGLIAALTKRHQDEGDPRFASIVPEAFPLWSIPLRDPWGHPTVVVVPLTEELEAYVDLQPTRAAAVHGWLTAPAEDFETLRKACSALRTDARAAVRYARRVQYALQNAIPELNDLAALLTTMLAFEVPESDPRYDSAMTEENFAWMHERLADICLLSGLLTRFHLEQSRDARDRDVRIKRVAKHLEAFPVAIAEELLSWGAAAPTPVWVEYLGAMVDCAAALAVAPRALGQPLIEAHFVHIFRALVRQGVPLVDPATLPDPADRALAQAALDFDDATLAPFDRAARPALPQLTVGLADFKEMLDLTIKPITYFEAVASAVGTLAPVIAGYLVQSKEHSTVSAALYRAAIALTGVQASAAAQRRFLETLRLAGPRGRDGFRQAVQELHQAMLAEALEKSADALDKRLYSGMTWPLVQVLVELTAAMHVFQLSAEHPRVQRSDAIAALQALKGAADVGVRVLVTRYETALQKLGPGKLTVGLTGDQAATWLKFVGKEGSSLVGLALSVWYTRTVVDEKQAIGDPTWRSDTRAAIYGVLLTALGTVAPVFGLIVGFALGLATALGPGSIGPGTQRYYASKWKAVAATVFNIPDVADVNVDAPEFHLRRGYREDQPLPLRIRALAMRINEGWPGKPGGKQLRFWALTDDGQKHAKNRALAAQGFGPDDIALFYRP